MMTVFFFLRRDIDLSTAICSSSSSPSHLISSLSGWLVALRLFSFLAAVATNSTVVRDNKETTHRVFPDVRQQC
jgi:hypothetical protein